VKVDFVILPIVCIVLRKRSVMNACQTISYDARRGKMSNLGHCSKKNCSKKLCSKTWSRIFAIKIRLVQNLNNLVKPKLLNFSWILFDHLILYPFLNNFHFIFEHNSSLRYYFIFRILIILFSNYDFRTTILELRFSNYDFRTTALVWKKTNVIFPTYLRSGDETSKNLSRNKSCFYRN